MGFEDGFEDGIPEDAPTTRQLDEDGPTTRQLDEDGPTQGPESPLPARRSPETRNALEDEALTARVRPGQGPRFPNPMLEEDPVTESVAETEGPSEPTPPEPAERSNLLLYLAVIAGGGAFGALLAGLLGGVVLLVGGVLWVLSPEPVPESATAGVEVVAPAPEPAPAPLMPASDTDTDGSRFATLDARLGSADPIERVAGLTAIETSPHYDEALAWFMEHDEDATVRSTAFQEIVSRANTGHGDEAIQAAALAAVLTDRVDHNQRKASRAYAMVGRDLAPLVHVLQRGTPTARSEVVRAMVTVAKRAGSQAEARALLEANAEHLTSRSQRGAYDKAIQELSAAKGDADAQ